MAKSLFERYGGSEKISVPGLETQWAPFRGFSLLFDNPDQEQKDKKGKFRKLDSNVDGNPNLRFYQRLRNALYELDMQWLVNETSFCPLPPSTYHITVWDGLNDGNHDQVQPIFQKDLSSFFSHLPGSMKEGEHFLEPVYKSALLGSEGPSITCRFGQIVNWGNTVIVCRPDILPEGSKVYDWITEERKGLSDIYLERFGIPMANNWFPHITLGYFANQPAASQTMSKIDSWSDQIKERMEGLTISYNQIGLYSFTDMATFFRYQVNP
jgi:hypothetical protein